MGCKGSITLTRTYCLVILLLLTIWSMARLPSNSIDLRSCWSSTSSSRVAFLTHWYPNKNSQARKKNGWTANETPTAMISGFNAKKNIESQEFEFHERQMESKPICKDIGRGMARVKMRTAKKLSKVEPGRANL